MDHYLTTYRKDYLWPNLPKTPGSEKRGSGLAEVPKLSGEELAFYQACMQHTRPPDCRCPQYSGGEMPQLPPGKEGGWSRAEIMGPLLDPKLYPARVGASPETPTSRYDQPNAFLDKLQSKYPMLYSILQNEASPELKQRIDRDRNKTTYQVDYCETGVGAKFEGLQRAADDSGTGPCAQPMRLPGDPCRVAPRLRMTTPRTISKQAPPGADPRAKCETTSAVPPLGKTEYQDGVSKLGGIIMRDKLHRRVPKLSGEELAFYQACMQHTRPPVCRCPQYSGGEMPQLPTGKEGGWSRAEIMGPLLDPKLYPARVGASPETPTSRYDQPNAFLDKLQSKYPMLYSILQNEASPELKQRIDRDRNKTTYQVDYCETGVGAKFEGLQRAADDSGTGPCAQPMRLPGDPCRVAPRLRMTTPRTISKQAPPGADPRAKCETTSAVPPLGKTEYQDGVSKLGGIIMRDKLHRR